MAWRTGAPSGNEGAARASCTIAPDLVGPGHERTTVIGATGPRQTVAGWLMAQPDVRHLEAYEPLTKHAFRERFMRRFYDPAFDAVRDELERVCECAWDGYIVYRKSPRTRPAGDGFADPAHALPIEWLETRDRIREAERRQRDPASPSRFLLVSGSTRSEHTCPGEVSKTRRLVEAAREVIDAAGGEVDLLDVSHTGQRAPQGDSPVQGMRVDRDAPLQLALFLLSQSRAGTDQRLDGRAVSALGRRARRADGVSGALVSGAGQLETHDRSSGVRRWRQSRPYSHAWEGSGSGQGPGTGRVGLSEAPGRPRVRRRHPRRRGGRRNPATNADRLADGHGPRAGRSECGPRHIHRILPARTRRVTRIWMPRRRSSRRFAMPRAASWRWCG